MSSIIIIYKDLATNEVSSESIRLTALRSFFEDEGYGLIQILEVEQSFDGWESFEVLYSISVSR